MQPHLYGLCLVAFCYCVGFAQNDSQTSYRNPTVTLTKPLWQTFTTSFVHEPSYLAVSDDLVFHFQDQMLVATQLRDGQTRWTARVQVNKELLYQAGRVIFLDRPNILSVFDAETGKIVWSKPVETNAAIAVKDKQIFAMSFFHIAGGVIASYELETGVELWRMTLDDLHLLMIQKILLVTDSVVIVEGQKGGMLLHTISALDRQTGQQRWSISDTGMHVNSRLVYENDGILFFNRTYHDIGVKAPVTLEAIRVATGEILATTSYGLGDSYTGGVIYDNRFIVLFTHPPGSPVKESIYEFPLNTSSEIKEAIGTLQTEGDFGEWLVGPTDAFPKMFKRDHCIYGIYRDGQTTDCWVDTPTEIAQLDLLGNLLVVGFVDGSISVYQNDYPGYSLTTFQTDARFFGQFRVIDGILLVQTEKKLLAFRVIW